MSLLLSRSSKSSFSRNLLEAPPDMTQQPVAWFLRTEPDQSASTASSEITKTPARRSRPRTKKPRQNKPEPFARGSWLEKKTEMLKRPRISNSRRRRRRHLSFNQPLAPQARAWPERALSPGRSATPFRPRASPSQSRNKNVWVERIFREGLIPPPSLAAAGSGLGERGWE